MANSTQEPCQNPPCALQGPSKVTPGPEGGPRGGWTPMSGGPPPPPSSLRGSSGPHLVTSVRDWNRHRFRGLFWEHSAAALDRPRCSGACKYVGQLDVDHSAPGPFPGRSQTAFGVPIGPSGSPFPSNGEAQKTVPIKKAVWGGSRANVTGSQGYWLPLMPQEWDPH